MSSTLASRGGQHTPAELRNLIYSFTLASREPLSLYNFQIPPLLRVNSQMRREALPLFFAESTFDIELGSTFLDDKVGESSTSVHEEPFGENVDALGLPGSVEGVIENAGQTVLFRHVGFNLFRRRDLQTVRENREREIKRLLLAKLTLDVEMKRNSAKVCVYREFVCLNDV